MKKKKLEGKLKLNKEVISKLDNESMNNVKGGYITAHINTCAPCIPGGTNNAQCTVGPDCEFTAFVC